MPVMLTVFRKSAYKEARHIHVGLETKIRKTTKVGESYYLQSLQFFVSFPITTPANLAAVQE
jgi:hypothetical protein